MITDMDKIQFKSFQKIPRLSRGMILTEKIDGTNSQILIHPIAKDYYDDTMLTYFYAADGSTWGIWAGSRNRWLHPAMQVEGRDGKMHTIKKSDDNYGFAAWVMDNRDALAAELGPGRHYGEWWGKGINRGYGLDEKRFTLFNATKWAGKPNGLCGVVPILYQGKFDTAKVDECMDLLIQDGSVVAPGFMNPEGVVIFHEHSGHLYKKTIGSDGHKEAQNEL